jgi:molecular chaperone HtpG
MKKPTDCTDEEYKAFYQKVFMDYNEPLFWIHLNVDYPFNLKGILYFPKLRNEMDNIEGQIKLYNNQVFVADNIKEVIPEFLLLLKGVIDCPDLPLNVSRSFLQNDGFVKKISAHITKKVADKLVGMYKNERETYEKYWDDINPFIKFGCMRDDKFYDRMKEVIIFKNLAGKFTIISDYLDACKEKHENTVYYISDPHQQAQYTNMFKEHEMDAIYLDSIIDNNFVTFYEMKQEGVNFKRIDSDISDALKDKEEIEEDKKFGEKIEKLFKKALGDNESLKLKTENLKSNSVPAMILVSEEGRRMQEMMERMGGGMAMPGMPGIEETLVLNANNSLIQKVMDMNGDKEKKDDVALICKQIYDLEQLSNKPLKPEQMTEFIARSSEILEKLA